MNLSRLVFMVVLGAWSTWASAQCNYTMSFLSYLSSAQTASQSATLAGNLTSATFNLNFSGTGASYPSDMMVYIYAPNGNCIVWGGWNINPVGSCTNIGTGANNSWPGNWNTTVNGFYTYTLNLAAYGLNGSGNWTVTIQNAWTGSSVATYDLDIIFNGICAGDCFDPMACNFVPNATLPNNAMCEYAIDLYPSGLYDCDGNCYLDFDGDLICNALEIPGCQEPWACNYNPLATDPAPPGDPCVYPQNNQVDCNNNSLLPQFLSQPQNSTVSCTSIPQPPLISAQPAPASVAYHALFPESCYDANDEVSIQFQETTYAGSCPGNYTIERLWTITDCMGFQSSLLQVLTVVDNTPPVVYNDLDPISIDCNDPVIFEPINAQDACGGIVQIVGEPSFVTIPGVCDGEFTRKKTSVITDQCGNQTTVVQIIVVEDNDPPFWLNVPDEIIITDDINGDDFDLPVADDICSDFEVQMNTSYAPGDCPLSVVLTRQFIATDQCGNTSQPFYQTIQEATDLTASVDFEVVSCHDGSDGNASVEVEGGIPPYNVNWGGYNPNALPAGSYNVEVTDANLCNVSLPFLITEPGPFNLELSATVPQCTDPNSGTIAADINGGSGNVTLDWGGINPNAVPAGTYTVLATDASGCQAQDIITVLPAIIPDPLELDGDFVVAQGDSAAYYYEYTQGSNYEWTYTGATEQEVFFIFAISLLWDSLGTQEVCVTETNFEGCTGDPVCVEVLVEDDVWNVAEANSQPAIVAYPNPVASLLIIDVPEALLNEPYQVVNVLGQVVENGSFRDITHRLDIQSLTPGQYLLKTTHSASLVFHVQR
ncbi:MAG: T9SS type A sorting domain-containing protein [Bacteroidetes bacterium]|nr:T9SS type A sorting domain-containing protein [Bacteroidota bacterium]MDA0902778.1 T9SS type A sorting domain-containing protein [Bacteroidota bacterium]MDA1242915.1 T9SS type A sorting domain-containing protein [Bacteroidota bacterium]